jgi:hypothetical protein
MANLRTALSLIRSDEAIRSPHFPVPGFSFAAVPVASPWRNDGFNNGIGWPGPMDKDGASSNLSKLSFRQAALLDAFL